VTPTLNRVDLLRRTIDSLRAQTFGDYEHIVVDGGSSDGTQAMLSSLEGAYPLRWISEPDTGMYNAINKGLAMARGEVLTYLNSDDLYFPWTLHVVLAEFDRHPSADFVYGDALNIDDETGVRRMYWQFPFHRDTIRRTGFLAQPTVFWRRRAGEMLGGFDESLRYVADCDYWMRGASRCTFSKVNELLAVERNHAGTLRATGTRALIDELDRVRSRYVLLRGPRHHVANARNVRREWLLERVYYLMLLIQSRLPTRMRRDSWSRFLAADGSTLDAAAVLRLLLPKQPGVRERVLAPSRRWLEP
jgi:glycosyltransferase involved in cell wall biosynthesis